jgi:phage shock protein A
MTEQNDPNIVDAELVEPGPAGPVTPAVTGDYTDAGVPTFDYVRDRIEGRFATSVGTTELAGETQDAAALDKQLADRDKAGRDKLEEIRRAMRGE